jgi:enterochelin esterase-like enzyme
MNAGYKPHFPLSNVILLLMSLSILIACAPQQTTSTTEPATMAGVASAPVAIDSFEQMREIFSEIRTLPAEEAQARADQVWQSLVASERVPLVLGTQVIFFYKGKADQVSWSGSFNKWSNPGLVGSRIGQTDLWLAYTEFPQASRAEYKIILNGKDWIVDPENQHTTFSGLTGANNVVALEGFSVSDDSDRRNDISHGSLTDNLTINSKALGYEINYRVYLPAGFENMGKLPAIYVLDGNDFSDDRMGALPNILDNLIADKRINPVMAVFIDAREPGNLQKNRREDEFLVHPVEHASFIADELVPAIDHAYPTDARPEARVIMGVSYGGLSAYYIAAAYSSVFHSLAAFSPSLWVLASPQYVTDPEQREGSQKMLSAVDSQALACGGDSGYACPRLPIKIFISSGLPDWDVGNFGFLVADMEKQNYPVKFINVQEGHTWDNWRGLSDEMLSYFFGAD